MTGCLSQRDMAALISGSASPELLTFWRRHLRLCDSCASEVTRLRMGLEVSRSPNPQDSVPPDTTEPNGLLVGLEPNLQLGDFRLEQRLGSGGMGVVYQALQTSLNRRVALKILPSRLIGDGSAVERFHREARAAARLRHLNIVTIYAEGLEQGICYFAMEMIEGEPLDRIIADLRMTKTDGHQAISPAEDDPSSPERPLSSPATDHDSLLRTCRSNREYLDMAAHLIGEVADALAYAHRKGIIHRDVKPSNLILARDGRLVLLDFGIARLCEERSMTVTGSFVGTPRYMCPEQITNPHDKLDHRCDIYSLGVTLYELLTLQPLFDGHSREQVVGQILGQTPPRPRHVEPHIPTDLETICLKAIEKDPNRRYGSAQEMAEDLRSYLAGGTIKARPTSCTNRLARVLWRRKIAVVLAVALAIALGFGGSIAWKHYTTRWAQQDAMAEIDRLIQENAYFAASVLAEKAERYIPGDPLLIDRWPKLGREFTVVTDPPEAKVFISEYKETKPRWKYLGRAPLRQTRIPFGTCRWRLEKSGFVPVEVVRPNDLPSPYIASDSLVPKRMAFTLHPVGKYPDDMVWIPAAELDQKLLFHGHRTIPSAPAYLIDKYEVTNRQFKEFVDRGGYRDPNFWEFEFRRDGHVIPWSEAMDAFCDKTGHPGPATWQNGTYEKSERNCPVGGISWYEAAAYARFRDKDLPTIFHWTHAARADDEPYRITHLSNFGDGPANVGRHKGMGRFGLYDAAGNVREWCSNTIEGNEGVRCILGGTWNSRDTAFINGTLRSPWDRDSANGVRCVKYLEDKDSVPQLAFEPVESKCRDFANFRPISDRMFHTHIEPSYGYDATGLNARVELLDDGLDDCWRERITFDAAYPTERVIAYLHLPKAVKPPYQVVVWYPSGIARFSPWDARAYTHEMACILRSGRAVIVPFYKGTYDRRLEKATYPPDGVRSKNLYIQRSQDLRRSIDYLETRDDIDATKLAYVGLAWGGQMGPVMMAPEKRFKTGILLLGGICGCQRHPASDPANFAPQVKIPVLMLNGREDSLFPYETAQKPLFELLGTPAAQKRHVIFPGEHNIPWEYRQQYHKEIVRWLDHYLGPVRWTGEKPPGSTDTGPTDGT
jgi:eukaryotic-like serine/threonine-protein kinase